MNKKELLWKYIDGACSPEENRQVEEWLAEDPSHKAEWAMAVKLHQSLQEQELEQPSMRFARNVMDRLPQLYGKLDIRPLIPAFWRKVFVGVMSLIAIAYFGLVATTIDWSQPGSISQSNELSRFVETLASLPMQAMSLVFALSLSYILLAAADRRLKKRFG